MKIWRRIAVAGTLLMVTGGCADSSSPDDDAPGSSGDSKGPMSVTEALAAPENTRLRVRASLTWDGRTMMMCDRIAESSPVQCFDGAPLEGWDESHIPPSTPSAGGVQVVDQVEVVVERAGNKLVAVQAQG